LIAFLRSIRTKKCGRLAIKPRRKSSAKIFPKGTLLIALYGATIGKIGTLGIDAATNQAICGIYRNDYVDNDFLNTSYSVKDII